MMSISKENERRNGYSLECSNKGLKSLSDNGSTGSTDSIKFVLPNHQNGAKHIGMFKMPFNTFYKSKSMHAKVFLGGSCNPSNWRCDIAIPMLNDLGISYYNPQVDCWGPELLELENEAKENAEILFFVIDNQARSIASMIEAAQIAGTKRKLILVVHGFTGIQAHIFGEEITKSELEVLKHGQSFLQYLVKKQGISVFSQVPLALSSVKRVLHGHSRSQDTVDFAFSKKISFDHRDVYLGGSGLPSWRENIALPVLKKFGLTYYSSEEIWPENLNAAKLGEMEESHVLLFVISNKTRCFTPMIAASHFVGMEKEIVLCIQYIPEDAKQVDGEKLSQQAIKDYNRGRVYLSDLSTRANVPVYDDIEKAVMCAVEKSLALKNNNDT